MRNDDVVDVDVVLRVRVTEEQRQRWLAAAGSHRSLSDWAIDALNRAATLMPAS
jgi:hypothetical protein